jgi:uncharacterized caspase-like protein
MTERRHLFIKVKFPETDMSFLPRLILTCACLAWLAAPALAETRVALVIGNSAFQNVPVLPNPNNDAKLVAETLRGLGFSLVGDGPQFDLDHDTMIQKVKDLGEMAKGADVALFYYSGHGIELGRVNYLAPIDVHVISTRDVSSEMLDVASVLDAMSKAKLKIMVLDAGRDNPFVDAPPPRPRSARDEASLGTLVSFATQPGNAALDGDGPVSPYTKAFAEIIKRPGLDLFRTFNEIGLEVTKATDGKEQPWLSASPIDGDFYFAGPSVGGTTPKAGAPK